MRPKVNATLFALMIGELQAGPCSALDLANITGMGRVTMREYLQKFHQHGCVHIVDYEHDSAGRERAAIYGLGQGKDQPRRSPTTWAFRAKLQRSKRPMRELQRLAA